MSHYAPDHSEAEKGPTKRGTVDNLVSEQAHSKPLTPPSSAPSKSTPEPTPSTLPNVVPSTGTKRPDWNKYKSFDDLNGYPKGIPRLCAFQLQLSNGSIHPRFSYVSQRLLTHWELRVAFLQEELFQLDRTHPELGKRLSIGQRRWGREAMGKGGTKPDEDNSEVETAEEKYDLLLAELHDAWTRYCKLVMLDKGIDALPKAHPDEVYGLYNFLAGQDMQDADAFLPACMPKDCVTTASTPIHAAVHDLLYSEAARWLQNRLPRHWFDSETGSIQISLPFLYLAQHILQTLFNAGTILVPCGILMLGDLSPGGCFAVVVVFVLFCSGVAVRGVEDGSVWFSVVSTYGAVLMSFLAQLGSR